MFGYINVNRKELSVVEEQTYQSYYCGLCRQLKEIAGMKGQLLLNYDMTFLIILLSGLYEIDHEEITFTCALHPSKKKTGYVNEITKYAAAMDVVLSYHNLKDDYEDEGKITKKMLCSLYENEYQNIKQQYPKKVEAVENYLEQLNLAQQKKETNLDIVAGYTGQLLANLFCWKEDEWSKDLENLGFYMGKFIYIMDAYEDLKKDEKKGNYNPLSLVEWQSKEDYEMFCKQTLTCFMAECAKSFERMPILMNAEILRNILYSGVWTKYEYLQLKERTKSNKGSRKQ